MFSNLINNIKNYKVNKFKKDLIAGLTVGAVALPQNMAYALIIGINPVYGIYTSIVSMIVSSIFGISDYLVVGPTNVMAIAISSTLSQYNGENYLQFIFLLTFLIGIFQLLMAFMKLGKLVSYISHPVVVGLISGISLIIGAGQLSNLFGIEAGNGVNFFTTLYNFFINLNKTNLYSLLLGLLTITIILLLQKYKPKLPEYLISVIIVMLITYLFDLSNQVEVVSHFDSSLPKFNMINLDFATIRDLASSALSLSILGFIQVTSIVKSLGGKSKDKINMNREFISQGITNVVCSFFNSFAITGSFTNSFINYDAGAKTRLSEFITAIFFIIFLLLFSPLVKFIPVSSLAGIVIIVAIGMIDFEKITRTFKTTDFDAMIFIATFITTILLPRLDYAIYFGVLVSIILVLRNTSDIDYTHIDYQSEKDEEFSHKAIHDVKENECIIINIGGNVHFHSAKNLKEELDESFIKETDFIIRMRDIETIDITSLNELKKFIARVQKNGGRVLFSGINDKLYKYLEDSGILDEINEEDVFKANDYIFSSTKDALNEAQGDNDGNDSE